LRPGQTKQSLFENRVRLVPQRDRKTESPVVVADAEQAVFTPAVCLRAGVIVRERVPGGAARRVILAYSAPLALRQIRTPAPPCRVASSGLGLALTLRRRLHAQF